MNLNIFLSKRFLFLFIHSFNLSIFIFKLLEIYLDLSRFVCSISNTIKFLWEQINGIWKPFVIWGSIAYNVPFKLDLYIFDILLALGIVKFAKYNRLFTCLYGLLFKMYIKLWKTLSDKEKSFNFLFHGHILRFRVLKNRLLDNYSLLCYYRLYSWLRGIHKFFNPCFNLIFDWKSTFLWTVIYKAWWQFRRKLEREGKRILSWESFWLWKCLDYWFRTEEHIFTFVFTFMLFTTITFIACPFSFFCSCDF